MSISSSAVIVELNISVWTAAKLDRKATNAVLEANKATNDAGRFTKNLMAGTSLRKDIQDYAAGCRLWNNNKTLAWGDKGVRLLPTSIFMPYKLEINGRRDMFNAQVNTFLAEYPTIVANYEKAASALGTLFDRDDYPHVDAVREMFGFRFVVSPVPDSGDFRVDIPQQDLEELKEDYADSFDSRLGDAMKESWKRLHKMLSGMSKKLNDDGDSETKKRYHESLLTNALDLCEMLKHLNVTNDPALEQARKEVKAAVEGTNIEALKEDAHSRAGLKADVDAVLKQYEW